MRGVVDPAPDPLDDGGIGGVLVEIAILGEPHGPFIVVAWADGTNAHGHLAHGLSIAGAAAVPRRIATLPGVTNTIGLDADQVLSTTRAVRKRLDFDRPVPADLIRECVDLALQAPTGSNVMSMQFIIVTDPAKRQEIGRIYREIFAKYKASAGYPANRTVPDEKLQAQNVRIADSADYLGDHMGDAPVLVIACNTGPDRASAARGMSNVLPGAWSFMLAARARGLGTAWTSMHLTREQEVADLLGIPYDTVAQAVLTPLAYTKGTDFKPAKRPPAENFMHWDTW